MKNFAHRQFGKAMSKWITLATPAKALPSSQT